MNKKLLAVLAGVVCLAPSFARAQTKYDACSARPGQAYSVTADMADIVKKVASAPIDSSVEPAVASAIKTLNDYTASNNGQCVDKTVIVYLQNRGYDMVGDVKVSETRDSVALVSATSGVLLYGPSSIDDYAKRTFAGYLRSVADARDGGTDRLKRICEHLKSMPHFSGFELPDYCKALLNN